MNPAHKNRFSAILLCRLILNLRSFNTGHASNPSSNARQLVSVRFANAVLDNIGASVRDTLSGHGDPSNLEALQADTTWDRLVSNPLAIGLEEEIRQLRHDTINDEIFEAHLDADGDGLEAE